MKRILPFLISLMLVVALIPATAFANTNSSEAWDGSISQPQNLTSIDGVYYYEISTPQELAYIAQTGGDWLGYNYILTNDIVLNEATIRYDNQGNLLNDPDLLLEWTPIGDFTGIFDGGGHTVKGVYVDLEENAGFILGGAWESMSIKNLNLANSYIKGHCRVGGIISEKSETSTILNCSFSGAVVNNGSIENYSYGAGGIIGNGGEVIVDSCVNYGDIFAVNYAGGIMAHGSNGCINNCANYGKVIVLEQYGGGIAGRYAWSGYNEKINNCINYGSVSGDEYIGGICGDTIAEYSDCINKGDVMGNNCVGGIIGNAWRGSSFDNIYNIGKVSGKEYVGGVIGKIYGDDWYPIPCNNLTNSGVVMGDTYVGGLFGHLGDYVNFSNGASTGIVTGTKSTGALIGHSEHIWGKSTLSNCYYLKNDTANSTLNGLGNVADSTGIVEAKAADEFCYSEEGLLYGLHDVVIDKAVAATCTTEGKTEGSHCSVCNKVIAEQETLGVVSHKYDAVVKKPTCTETGYTTYTCKCGDTYKADEVAATDHSYEEYLTITTAGFGKEGKQRATCSACQATKDKVIAAAVVPTLKSYSFNNKQKTPTVTVKNTEGNKVSIETPYFYNKTRKSVGKYKVEVALTGENYSGSKNVYFKINPAGKSISRITSSKKAFTVKWSKPSSTYRKQMTGYKIRYSTSSKMSNAKTITVKSTTATSKKISSKIKSKKTYYVQLRTYKKIGSTYYYSDWSKVKKVKTK